MKKIILLKSHNGHCAGEVIEESNNVAWGLVDSGSAKYLELKDLAVEEDVEPITIKKGRKRKYD